MRTDTPIIPVPTLTYPLSNRHSGFLIPTPGYDNRFGLHYQQGYFWAINPSQDLTIAPSYYNNLGYGSDFTYRYYLDRRSGGRWFRQFPAADQSCRMCREWIRSVRMAASARINQQPACPAGTDTLWCADRLRSSQTGNTSSN